MFHARETLAAAARSAIAGVFVALFLLTAWGCLIAGVVVYLHRYLGSAEALLATGGALVGIAALIAVIFSARRSRPLAEQPSVSGDKVLQLITTILHLGPRQAGVFVLLAAFLAGGLGALMIAKGGPKAGKRESSNS